MTSKQEKLAAARKKLKEFQVKSKDGVNFNQKNNAFLVQNSSKEGVSLSVHLSRDSTPALDESQNILSSHTNLDLFNISDFHNRHILEEKNTKNSEFYLDKPDSVSLWSENNVKGNNENSGGEICRIVDNVESVIPKTTLNSENCGDELKKSNHFSNFSTEFCKNDENNCMHSNKAFYNKTLEPNKFFKAECNEEKISENLEDSKKFSSNSNTSNILDDIIQPLQSELQNHAQTITILVQQRNEAQNALNEAQNSLVDKSGEIENLNHQVTCLTLTVQDLQKKFGESEEIIKTLKLENEENLLKSNNMKSHLSALQSQFDSKEEELFEIKKKYEEKNKECQQLMFSLNEIQSQLSLSQIQLQKFTSGEHLPVTIEACELQKENLNLNQKIEDLKKEIEVLNTEKEQSSQNFHIYAKQCNSQLTSLYSQLESVLLENSKLKEENMTLHQNLEVGKENNLSSENHQEETLIIQKQILTLKDENDKLKNEIKNNEADVLQLKYTIEEKDLEIKNLSGCLKKIEEENEKLISESEVPKADKRLLEAIESDKVAAAKAVSQNQKLKLQQVELEKAIMKLSQEKLELTDQLSHEKHINKELLTRLENLKPYNSDDECHKDHRCDHIQNIESPVNDSNEVGELKNIIRQLQEDKSELMVRLNSLSSLIKKEEINMKDEELRQENKLDNKESDIDCENTRIRLQQMEEKVRKTMNEIAVLDEEKEKLEHLVLQLQSETETIGEYVTLYQQQRMALRRRAQEKDIQLIQLSKDKEELRSKLIALDELVQHLLLERSTIFQKETKLNMPEMTSSVDSPEVTAEKIRALISDIGSSTLVSKHSVTFEHCSCCSGRLMTI